MGQKSRGKWLRRAARFVRDGGPNTVQGQQQRETFDRKEKFDRFVPIADRLIARVAAVDAMKRTPRAKAKRR